MKLTSAETRRIAIPWALFGMYCLAGAIFATLMISVNEISTVFLSNAIMIAIVWAGLLIVRPKPTTRKARQFYTAGEVGLVACLFSFSLVLIIHPGWTLGASPNSGLLSLLWGLAWVANWLGPLPLAFLALIISHYMAINTVASYNDHRVSLQRQTEEERLQAHLQNQLNEFLSDKNSSYVAARLSTWLGGTAFRPFILELPSSALHITARSDSENGILITLTQLNQDPEISTEYTLSIL